MFSDAKTNFFLNSCNSALGSDGLIFQKNKRLHCEAPSAASTIKLCNYTCPTPIAQSSGSSPCNYSIHYVNVSLFASYDKERRERESEKIPQLLHSAFIHSSLFLIICPQSLANAIGREQVFEEGKSEIEPQTAPRVLHYSTRLQL